MFDWLRNIRQSAEEKQQERLNAYLDNALPPPQREQLEQEIAQDASLRAAVEQFRQIKLAVRQMPRAAVPHNFTLTPAQVEQPIRRPRPAWSPALSLATVVAAVLFLSLLLLEQVSSPALRDVPVSMSAETTAYNTAAGGDDAAADQSVRSLTEPAAPQAMPAAAEAEIFTEEAAVGMMSGDAAAPPIGETDEGTGVAELPAQDEPTSTETPTVVPPLVTTTITPTPLPAPTPTVIPQVIETRTNISSWRLAQIGLGVLFLTLLAATVYRRRNSG